MDPSIFLILVQDGMTTGAIYALLALSLVLVFTITRVIFLPQGEFVAYGALPMAALEMGTFPATAWMLVLLGAAAAVTGLVSAWLAALCSPSGARTTTSPTTARKSTVI